MRYYYINTDTDALGYSPHDKWIELEHAFTSGESQADYKQYGERALGRLEQGDICFMYANGLGVVAAGEVKEPWDSVSYEDEDRLVYQQTSYTEYRIQVNWHLPIVDNPVPASDLIAIFNSNPMRTLQQIHNTVKAQILLEKVQRRVTG